VLEKPLLIPRDEDAIVYCTSPSDKTSRTVLRRALALHFFRLKILKGGWRPGRAKDYPGELYKEVFRLYTPSLAPPPR
jgi:hypothetical protein